MGLVSLIFLVGILTGACDKVIAVGIKFSLLEFLSLANKYPAFYFVVDGLHI